MSVAASWGRAPSSYMNLPGLQGFWLDEAAAVWLQEVRKSDSDGAEWVGEDIL